MRVEISGAKWEKSMDAKAGSLRKSVILINLQPAASGKKGKTLITCIRSESSSITTDYTDNKKTIREYYGPGWVAQSAGASFYTMKVVGSIPGQGTYLGCGFKPQLGCEQEATD